MKTVPVAYFSESGNTEIMAGYITEGMKACQDCRAGGNKIELGCAHQ